MNTPKEDVQFLSRRTAGLPASVPNFSRARKYKLILELAVMLVLLSGGITAALSGDTSANLTAWQIFGKMQDKYTSLLSYGDEGRLVTRAGDSVMATQFTTRLARPDYYRIEWNRYTTSPFGDQDTGPQGAWSLGMGDYVQMGWGLQWQYNRDVALANVSATSSGPVTIIPRMFFDVRQIGQPDNRILNLNRLEDARLGKIQCFVLTGQLADGETNTFWIGKRDFLIRQISIDASSDVVRAALAGTIIGNPAFAPHFQGFSSTETFTNIVVNKTFSRADFVPSFPQYQRPNF